MLIMILALVAFWLPALRRTEDPDSSLPILTLEKSKSGTSCLEPNRLESQGNLKGGTKFKIKHNEMIPWRRVYEHRIENFKPRVIAINLQLRIMVNSGGDQGNWIGKEDTDAKLLVLFGS